MRRGTDKHTGRHTDGRDHYTFRLVYAKCNKEVRRRTDQHLSHIIIRTTRLKFFGHIARNDPSMDHSRALMASV